MGEEYGEEAPFLYFISHTERELVEAVRQGRAKEFEHMGFSDGAYDPQSPEIFQQCKLNWEQQEQGKHHILWKFYQHLIQLRRRHPVLKKLDKTNLEATCHEANKLLLMHRWSDSAQVFYIMNFGDREVTFDVDPPVGSWQKLLDSSDSNWQGPGATLPEKLTPFQSVTISAKSFALYQA
jgi:maltooligosyltrehalose trehalohydrolase